MKISKQQIPIRGMHCAACSSRIEKTVSTMEGVEKVAVNLAAELMQLSWDGERVSLDQIGERIQRLGFEMEVPKVTPEVQLELGLKNMHCGACSARIEKVAGGLEGVVSAQVNLAAESGVFLFNPDAISRRRIRESIEQLGFDTIPLAGGATGFDQAREESRNHLRKQKRNVLAMLFPALLLLYIAMGHMVGLALPKPVMPDVYPLRFALLQGGLALLIMWRGRSFFQVGIPALLRGIPNMDSLIAVGTGAAFIFSSWNVVEMVAGGPVADLYFESAGVLIAMVSLGKYLEAKSKIRASDAMGSLMRLIPDTVTLLSGKEQKTIGVDELEKGDLVLVRPGERIAVDGEVMEGISTVDESMLTGESMPVSKKSSSLLTGGTLNINGVLTMKVNRVGSDTTLAGITELVRNAQGSKAPIAALADRVSLYFVPTVMAVAVFTGLLWYFLGGVPPAVALRFFISVLVVACPCALGLATPIAIMAGTGRGAELGVLIKSGGSLQLAEKVSTVVFDKTGTLTNGKPRLTDCILIGESRLEDEVLALAAGVESGSEHPLGEAVVAAAREKGLQVEVGGELRVVPGKGISGVVLGKTVAIGNRSHMEHGATGKVFDELSSRAAELSENGKTVLYMAVDGQPAALLAVADTLKDDAAEAVAQLQQMGLQVIMLTGDNIQTAGAMARRAGIHQVEAQVMPEEKATVIKKMRVSGELVAMVGDGINDSPALAEADVGIAMGTGADTAVESGDIVAMSGSPSAVVTALGLSRAVMGNIRQNLFWAFAYNVMGIPVAAGLPYIFGGPQLSPMIAGGAMALSSISVVSNGLRLRFFGKVEGEGRTGGVKKG